MEGAVGHFTGQGLASPVRDYLERLHGRFASLREGVVASYIPELAHADPDWFAICIATPDGQVYEVGDSRQPFTIQSISKPLVYGLALEDRGRERVLEKIGVEPSGEAFNSISLAPGSGSPLNPMINAGAIAAASMVAGHSEADRLDRVLSVASLYAGRRLDIDTVVFESERSTGHRNRAIGHMLRNFGIITEDPEPALNLYFQQCSIRVDCRDLALIAATLANGGINPVTKERAVRSEFVDNILSVMTTCGMYDYAGEWVYRVGMPAKSGVSGGILAVRPGQLGIGIFSPLLDPQGNSVRGVRVCEALSRDLNLHFLAPPRSALSVVHSRRSLASLRSKRRRRAAEQRLLDTEGSRARVCALQGDLNFPAIDVVLRNLTENSDTLKFAVVDLRRVARIDDAAGRMLAELVGAFAAQGKVLLFSSAQSHARFRRTLDERVSADGRGRVRLFADLDSALEWCESRLLAEHPLADAPAALIALADHSLCQGIEAPDLAHLESVMTRERFAAAEIVVRKGEALGVSLPVAARTLQCFDEASRGAFGKIDGTQYPAWWISRTETEQA